jgi:hypothetical protein
MRFLRSASLLVLLLTTACDDTFSPIEASALRYSLYGYLDASADTQWIRVTPVRPVAVTTSEPLDVRVTLEHLGTHRVVELRDSVFRQTSANPELGGGAFYSHNFWTAEPIEPGASYRLTVAKEGSPPVETLVQVPPDYDLEIWLSQTQEPDLVHLTGLEHVGLLFLLTKFTDTCGSGLHRAIFSAPPSSTGERHARILSQFPGRPGCTPTDRLQQDIQVIGSGAPWPTRLSGGGGGQLGDPGQATFGENGLGFLAGVLSREIPYEECRLEGSNPPEYCILRYEEGSASIRGTITDTRCGENYIVAGASLELREVEPESPDYTVVRPTRSGLAGRYLIRGLTPGKRYALQAEKHSSIPIFDFIDHTDTLVFSPNEILDYDIELQRRDCPA